MSARMRRLLLLVVTSLVACGGSSTTAPSSASSTRAAKVGLVFDLGGRGDGSFNDAAAAGLDRAAQELGLETRAVTSRTGENREELLRLLASEGYGLVIGVGFAFAGPITAASRDHPDTAFAIVDAPVTAPNVVSLEFAPEEGAFLVGVAAARKSRTGRLGFVGGVEIDGVKAFQAGFTAGAHHVNPTVTVGVRYLSQPPDLSGFADPARAREVARGMYQHGADIVFHVSGGSGVGVFEAARDSSTEAAKVWAIGVDSDQYHTADPALRPFILTSMLKRVDVAVFETISAFDRGEFKAGAKRFNLAEGGIDYSTSGGFIADVEAELQSIKAQIIRGDIRVPDIP